MFTIKTVGNGANDWIVIAEWFGQERTVHGPVSVFEATQWAAAQS